MTTSDPHTASSSTHPKLLDPFRAMVRASTARVIMPIAVYPGLALTGATIGDLVTNAQVQCDAALALHERFHSPVLLSAMDLSAEAEAFGAEVHFTDQEVPTVTGPLLSSPGAASALSIPAPGARRTAVYLETVRKLKAHANALAGRPLVLGGCIGPFSLAGRLVGVTEAFGLTITDPAVLHALIAKCAGFLTEYVRAFRSAGADGVIMAEPSAGLLSPGALAAFSSDYIRPIVESLGEDFSFVLHNCAARPVQLAAIFATGAQILHFGAPMDLPAALGRAPEETVICGNLDPAGVFCQSSPDFVAEQTRQLLATTAGSRNHVLSSGCDLPPQVPLANLQAFFTVARVP